ncbi:MAG TPA: helicase-related protein [Gemmatimonadaceae bacterium]|nr:helicase-related protein [Gemmatimonadaceae bacterium]
MARIESAINEFGGALLCDEVGMGKTFVATAIARRYARRLVVAPAALSQMWTHALRITEIDADFVSFEKLSGIRSKESAEYDLLIIDEAHHARNRATRRYARLQELSRRAKLLLLTATPIHNRRKDLSALLSLFLGSRANALTQAELARCIVRRDHEQLKSAALFPNVLPTVALQTSDDPRIVRELMMLPDPIPVRDGGLGRSLIGRGLVHQWASSEAALNEALRRRIARAFALIASLEAGTYPTETELRTWIFDDGALQLGFPELLSAPTEDATTLLESVRLHSNALEQFHASHSARSSLDIERSDMIASLRAAHPKAKIVAFAQYTETVSMFFRGLAKLGGVGMLTAHGARVAGGRLSRSEALSRFAPRALNAPPPVSAEQIDLLLSTDLLSEGVNLQDAEIVVHLDIPWTAARLEQRVGRVARMGSAHSSVSVYLIRPPDSAAALLENEILVQRKWDIARRVVGSASTAPFPDQSSVERGAAGESVTKETERLRAILSGWRRPIAQLHGDEMCVASISSPRSGFVAGVSVDGEPKLVVGLSGHLSTDLESQITACHLGNGVDVQTNLVDHDGVMQQLREWTAREYASVLAGLADSGTLRRKRLVNRIDTAIENAPPHSRTHRLATAARARSVATAQHGAAIEAELDALARAPLSDDEWLAAVAQLDSGPPESSGARNEKPGFEIHGLLLCATIRDPRSPPARLGRTTTLHDV